MSRLSAIVTTYNEQERIGDCLAHLRFADELLVVDSFSTDQTVEVASRSGAQVVQHEYQSPAAQKNWALARASGEWVVFVDADERVTPELAVEIQGVIGQPQAQDGYEIRRRNFFLGHEIRHCGWQNDWVLRLARRDRARYLERKVHEQLAVEGRVGRLRGALLHHSYRTLEDFWRKMPRYADWNAQQWMGGRAVGRGLRTPPHQAPADPERLPRAESRGSRAVELARSVWPLWLAAHPPLRFLKAYLLQGGFLDGMPGLLVCALTAVYALAKDMRIWEMAQHMQGRPARPGP